MLRRAVAKLNFLADPIVPDNKAVHSKHVDLTERSIASMNARLHTSTVAATQVDKETYFLSLLHLASGPLSHVTGQMIGEAERLGLLPDRIDHLGG